MSLRVLLFWVAVMAMVAAVVPSLGAQTGKPASPPGPATHQTPRPPEDQEPVRIFTEEVRLPLVAHDDEDRFDPTVEPDDILVLEDNVPQQIRSVRRTPASVLLLLDTSSQMGLSKSTNNTREVALRLVSALRPGDQIAILQYGDRPEMLQDWTTDKEAVEKVLKTKLHSGRGERLPDAMLAAAAELKDRPAGNRHIVLVTDGVDTPGGHISYEDAYNRLLSSQATLHFVSYTEIMREAVGRELGRSPIKGGSGQPRIIDPQNQPPGTVQRPVYDIARIDLDFKLRHQREAYVAATWQSEQRLGSLAEETGGRIFLPASVDEMARQGAEVARDIGQQYVITYAPKRPLASAPPGEYRHIQVASRRVGLRLRSRRGYVVAPAS